MSKKNLNVTAITNELEGASAFFSPRPQSKPEPDTDFLPSFEDNQEAEPDNDRSGEMAASAILPDRKENPLPISKPDSMLASTPASVIASKTGNQSVSRPKVKTDDYIETIRKTVKQVGKESLFVRLTPEEKQRLSAMVYSLNDMYRSEGRKTSENEISRIAVNWLLEDYQTHEQASVLAQVLAALNA